MRLLKLQKLIKVSPRGSVLAFSLLQVLLRFGILRLKRGKELSLRDRADWLHEACAIIARRLSMSVSASGPTPNQGLLVSNHLSYLDILLYSALMPCIFVSKSEVLQWPVFGILARCGGTIFVERGRAQSVHEPSREIAEALRLGIPVVLFPEGTSTDGGRVLPFRSAFFEPAISNQASIYPAAIGYWVRDGAEADLCYYGEVTFFPHLLSVLGQNGVKGMIEFGNEVYGCDDRKTAAVAAWKSVVALRERMAVAV